MYSDVFCKVYNAFGWNYYPEAFGQQLLQWLPKASFSPKTALDMACGTGILCRILQDHGIRTTGMDLSSGMIAIARQTDPRIRFDVADMITYRLPQQFDLVTCTGDALNHIPQLQDLERIFQNVHAMLNPGGYFVFDILNEHEISTSEPFEMDYDETTRVWFQMTQPNKQQVELKIRVYEQDVLQLEETICETVHDPARICQLLRSHGFTVCSCADSLLADGSHGTTWYVIARREDCDTGQR